MRSRAALVLVALLAIPACGTFKVPAPRIHEYRLEYEPPPVEGEPLSAVLRVAPFGTAAVYDRTGIVYREDDYSTGAYFYERWMAHPATMIADLVARDLAASGIYRAVEQGASTLPTDYNLSAEIEEIEERCDGAECRAHLRLRVLLDRTRARRKSRVAFQQVYDVEEPCSAATAHELVAAMSRAMRSVSRDIQKDIHQAIVRTQRSK